MSKIKVLDIFSGIGGFSLACRMANEILGNEHFETVAFAEIDPFCRAILKKHWPDVYQFEDVKLVTAESFRQRGIPRPELIVGGFPCQDISVAGKAAGIEGKRSGLWSEFHRIICEFRPAYCLIENVPALRTRGADRVLGDLEAAGYTAGAFVVGADDIGATHRRKRAWILAYSLQQGTPPVPASTTQDSKREQDGWTITVSASGRGFSDPATMAHSGHGAGWTERTSCGWPFALCEWPANHGEAIGSVLDVANADSSGLQKHDGQEPGRAELKPFEYGCEIMGNSTNDERCLLHRQERNPDTDIGRTQFRFPPARSDFRGWAAVAEMDASQMPCVEREIRHETDGLSSGLFRRRRSARNATLKALGNSIVPQCAVPFLLSIARST